MTNGAPADRPLSPHLQIWRFTPTMAASITHRITGVGLYTGTALIALWVWSIAMGPEVFAPVGAFLVSPFGYVILFGYIWALCFHLLSGLRYLYFDTGRGLAPKTATRTSLLVYAASLLLSVAIAYGALEARGAM